MKLSRICFCAALTALLAACTTTPPEKVIKPGEMKLSLKPVEYASLPAMPDQNWQPALTAFKESCKKMSAKAGWQEVCSIAQTLPSSQAKSFFAAYFTPYQAVSESMTNDGELLSSDTGK